VSCRCRDIYSFPRSNTIMIPSRIHLDPIILSSYRPIVLSSLCSCCRLMESGVQVERQLMGELLSLGPLGEPLSAVLR